MIQELAIVLTEPLTYLYNLCLVSGTCPLAWKKAIIKPLYKSGTKTQFKNYRPISNTSIFSRIMEKLIVKRIQNYFESNLLWHPSQHGFCKKRSCNTQLLEVITDFHRMADEGLMFDCIYIDFSKAFNKISILLLLQKCEVYHLGARTLNWIGDYLTGRMQKVIVGDALSSAEMVLSGVPQGSCLGPVLFCLFINDLPLVVHHSTVKMFADDVKLYCSLTNSDEALLLQKDLDAVHNW